MAMLTDGDGDGNGNFYGNGYGTGSGYGYGYGNCDGDGYGDGYSRENLHATRLLMPDTDIGAYLAQMHTMQNKNFN